MCHWLNQALTVADTVAQIQRNKRAILRHKTVTLGSQRTDFDCALTLHDMGKQDDQFGLQLD